MIFTAEEKRLMIKAFRALRDCRKNTKSLASSISNLEKVFRDKILMDALISIKTYGRTKEEAIKNRRLQGVYEIQNKFLHFRSNLLKIYFNRFYANTKSKNDKSRKMLAIVGKLKTSNLRKYFKHWSKIMAKVKLVQELNETGPVTAEIHEARRVYNNLIDFMKEEGFTDDEI